ncbi:hypothetical protein LZ32DRAFT_221215 [Colletotrichum eremochloae]|nr:hypothetical protein LZ32DRAFT_221215 [Colletotrichum eremochloae]
MIFMRSNSRPATSEPAHDRCQAQRNRATNSFLLPTYSIVPYFWPLGPWVGPHRLARSGRGRKARRADYKPPTHMHRMRRYAGRQGSGSFCPTSFSLAPSLLAGGLQLWGPKSASVILPTNSTFKAATCRHRHRERKRGLALLLLHRLGFTQDAGRPAADHCEGL